MFSRVFGFAKFAFRFAYAAMALIGLTSAIGLVALVNQWVSIDQFQHFVGLIGEFSNCAAASVGSYISERWESVAWWGGSVGGGFAFLRSFFRRHGGSLLDTLALFLANLTQRADDLKKGKK